MVKTQVYLPEAEFKALHAAAKRAGQSTSHLIREAIRRAWLRPEVAGPIALWTRNSQRTSVEHDAIMTSPVIDATG